MNPATLYALAAFGIWGAFPLYYRELASLSALAQTFHRIVGLAVFMALWAAVRRDTSWLRPYVMRVGLWLRLVPAEQVCEAAPSRALGTFMLSALLVSANWLIYVWAVQQHRVVEASLGYFINPLANVMLGVWVLKERLARSQWLAISLAALGVTWLTWRLGHVPWIALGLASTFSLYGLVRKTAPLDSVHGLSLEALILLPLGLLGLSWMSSSDPMGQLIWPRDAWETFLLLIIGPVTAIPLMAFAAAARGMPLATLGLFQYMTPSIQLLQGVILFHEPFNADRLIGFALIWVGLAIHSARTLWLQRDRSV